MTQEEVITYVCRITALVYLSIGDYSHASDGFCKICPNTNRPNFRHDGKTLEYIKQAVIEKLKKDGYEICQDTLAEFSDLPQEKSIES